MPVTGHRTFRLAGMAFVLGLPATPWWTWANRARVGLLTACLLTPSLLLIILVQRDTILAESGIAVSTATMLLALPSLIACGIGGWCAHSLSCQVQAFLSQSFHARGHLLAAWALASGAAIILLTTWAAGGLAGWRDGGWWAWLLTHLGLLPATLLAGQIFGITRRWDFHIDHATHQVSPHWDHDLTLGTLPSNWRERLAIAPKTFDRLLTWDTTHDLVVIWPSPNTPDPKLFITHQPSRRQWHISLPMTVTDTPPPHITASGAIVLHGTTSAEDRPPAPDAITWDWQGGKDDAVTVTIHLPM